MADEKKKAAPALLGGTEGVKEVAPGVAAAGIQRLAPYHLVPAPDALIERMFLRGLPDDVILTRDLHTFDLPADSDEIRITEP